MLYLVHKHTKEHRRYADASDWPDADCMIVVADPDGWIEWQGGECPLPDKHPVELRFGTGDTTRSRVSGPWVWAHDGNALPIIAYRPILDADTKVSHPGTMAGPDKYRASGGEWPEPTAWDGESWPISIGTELLFNMPDEYGMTSTWMNAKVIGHDGDACVVAVDGDGYHGSSHRGDFRPIRSEEDRAVEEMVKTMNSVVPRSGDKRPVKDVALALYRAGYRKQ